MSHFLQCFFFQLEGYQKSKHRFKIIPFKSYIWKERTCLTHHYYQVYPIPACLAVLKNRSCKLYHPKSKENRRNFQSKACVLKVELTQIHIFPTSIMYPSQSIQKTTNKPPFRRCSHLSWENMFYIHYEETRKSNLKYLNLTESEWGND